MTRIVPPANYNLKPDYPKWLNPNTVAEAGEKDREEVNKLTKKASAPDKVVVSYMCNNCSKIIQAGNSDLLKQATLASKANKEFIPTCPDCGNEVKPYQVIEKGTVISNIHSMNEAKRVDLQEGLQKEASSRGTYNTFIDQRIVYRAIEELNKYASKNGMTGCRARYLRSEHKKEAGSNTSTLNNIECNLEWLYGRNQKGNATATIGVDVAGNFIFPKVFKVASGMEYPFKEEYIRQLEKEPSLFQSFPSPRKSDVPTIRKSDPSRFRAYAGKEKVVKVGEYKKNASEYPEYDEFLRGQYYDSVPEEEAAGELLKLYPEYFDTYEDALDYVNLAFSQYSNYGEPGIRESSKKVGEYKLKKKSNVLGWKGVNIDSDKPRKGYIYEINGALFGIEGYGVNYSSNLYTKAYLVKLLKGPYEEWIEGMKYWVNEDFFNNATQKNILNSIDPDEVINVYEATINRMEEEGVEEDLEKSALDNTAQYFGVSNFVIQEILDKYNS